MNDNGKVVFSMELLEVTKQRTEAVGMDYAAVMQRCGVSESAWDTAKKLYKRNAKANGWDETANLGAMKTETYNKICIGFMVSPDTYKVDEPPKATASASVSYTDDSDIILAFEALKSQQEVTNQLLREIRSAVEDNKEHGATREITSRLDKVVAALNEIKSNSIHLIDIKKEASYIKKAVASIDQRLSGINQIVASNRIEVSHIKGFIERWTTGK